MFVYSICCFCLIFTFFWTLGYKSKTVLCIPMCFDFGARICTPLTSILVEITGWVFGLFVFLFKGCRNQFSRILESNYTHWKKSPYFVINFRRIVHKHSIIIKKWWLLQFNCICWKKKWNGQNRVFLDYQLFFGSSTFYPEIFVDCCCCFLLFLFTFAPGDGGTETSFYSCPCCPLKIWD